ncbi:trans-aconitate 2-methyltransferase [Nocardioides xinjiangensis]|uniref:trans-aconitate 2-methyltransferase n=1 Tax=Nocardioides xinjiangensis TaxID=2817376 RepID=UPI001B31442E|nr:trans-aconitate 2-methyltransferase [Nocardioides sp. SYSU D00514]
MSHTWDPDRYLAYADERGRPFVDLLARVPAENPRVVVDLGCGPGNLTALLADRWRSASITGVDSSPEMIEAARSLGGVRWEVGDLRDWARPDPLALRAPIDVLVSNATLQWVPEHLELLPGLVDRVAEGGWLALQVPGNFDEPSHTTRAELASQEPYARHVRDVRVPASHSPETYARVLMGLGCEVDAWETTYLHVLTGPDPVFDWVSGTGARPTLQALPDDLRPRFEDEFKALLREAYPADAAGRVLLPFRRIFVVARKPQGVAVR